MRIKPLTGQVLIEVQQADKLTAGGIEIPERSRSPEEVAESHMNPEKPPPIQGIVREIGPWPKLKNGMALLPEYGRGAMVLVKFNSGVAMQRNIGERLRMVNQKDIIAVLQ